MNLKNNKGYVITDVSIAIIILLILVPVIMGMVFGIGSSKIATEIKSEAINIAINTIEAAKGLNIDDVGVENILENVKESVYKNKMTIEEETENQQTTYTGIIETEKASYKLHASVKDYKEGKEDDENIIANFVKTVTVTVQYKIRGEDKTIELNTVVK